MKMQTREFLNKEPGLSAHIKTNIEIGECNRKFDCDNCNIYSDPKDRIECSKNKREQVYGSIEIWDCSKVIDLDFSIHKSSRSKSFFENNMNKIDTLLSHLQKYKDNYVKAYNIFKQNCNEEKKNDF